MRRWHISYLRRILSYIHRQTYRKNSLKWLHATMHHCNEKARECFHWLCSKWIARHRFHVTKRNCKSFWRAAKRYHSISVSARHATACRSLRNGWLQMKQMVCVFQHLRIFFCFSPCKHINHFANGSLISTAKLWLALLLSLFFLL